MRGFAIIFGLVFLMIGIAGFVPAWVTESHFASVFKVNIWLNLLHIATGILGFWVALFSNPEPKFYFQIVGISYAFLAILGFIFEDKKIFGIFASNNPDTWFHVIVAVAALILGYGGRERTDGVNK